MPDAMMVDPRALLLDLRRTTAAYEQLLRGITLPRLFFKPDARAWSAAQLLDHLIVANAGYIPQLRDALARLRAEGKRGSGPFKVGFLAAAFVKSVSPGSRSMSAPERYRPTDTPTDDLPRRFLEQQEAIDRLLVEADGLDLRALKVTSPANRLVKVRVGEAFLVIVRHEERHLLQLQRILAAAPAA